MRRPSSLQVPSLMTSSELLRSSYSNTASNVTSPAKTPSKNSGSTRRRKLDSLRRRMMMAPSLKDNEEEDASAESDIDESDTSSDSEIIHVQCDKVESLKVVNTMPCQSSVFDQSASSINAQEQVLVAIPPPPPPGCTLLQPSCSTKSQSSYSTGSSKSNTMERLTDSSLLEHNDSKCNSLERGPSLIGAPAYTRSVSAFSSKSNSLTRDMSVSGADVFITAFENENEYNEYLRRRNSEAAEVIEQLTCNLVNPIATERIAEEEKEDSPSALDQSTPTFQMDMPSTSQVVFPSERPAQVSPPIAKVAVAGSSTNLTPDIISSNVVKFNEPVAPPRRRRTLTHSINDSNGSVESLPAQFSTMNRLKHDRLNLSANPGGSLTLSPRGKLDSEALENTTLKNLDTGEEMTMAEAKDTCDPIWEHMMRRMSSAPGNTSHYAESVVSSFPSDSDSVYSSSEMDIMSTKSMPLHKRGVFAGVRDKTVKARRNLGKTVHRAFEKTRNVAGEAENSRKRNIPTIEIDCDYYLSHKIQGDASTASESEEENENTDQSTLPTRVRSRHQKKGPFDFEQVRQVQHLHGEHTGAVWCVKFSLCGRLLATAGQDNVIRVWVLTSAYQYFNNMRHKYTMEVARKSASSHSSSNLDTLYQLGLHKSNSSSLQNAGVKTDEGTEINASECVTPEDASAPFMAKPFCCYRGHSADVLDIAWSKNYFVLSSSMDRTVRLWHASRTECLCCFQHIDFVTCIAFLPKDDRYFVSGSLDAKLRLWHIPDKKVALWNEVEGNKLVTALTFVKNGKMIIAGTFDGRCIFYATEQLKYHTMIDVRSSRGKNARGHKVTGLSVFQDKLLVTSNDSRVRLYDLRDCTLTCKYKGATNTKSQIRASFSPDATHIICGSEDRFIYLWRTSIDTSTLGVRKDRNGAWERIRAHNAVVTAAIFAPKPELIFQQVEETKQRLGLENGRANNEGDLIKATGNSAERMLSVASSAVGFKSSSNGKKAKSMGGDVIVSADLTGNIYVFLNRTRMKTGGSTFFSP